MRLVRGGEDTYLELKVKLSNPERIAQGIVALANTGGGTIVFGVNDQLRVPPRVNPYAQASTPTATAAPAPVAAPAPPAEDAPPPASP